MGFLICCAFVRTFIWYLLIRWYCSPFLRCVRIVVKQSPPRAGCNIFVRILSLYWTEIFLLCVFYFSSNFKMTDSKALVILLQSNMLFWSSVLVLSSLLCSPTRSAKVIVAFVTPEIRVTPSLGAVYFSTWIIVNWLATVLL